MFRSHKTMSSDSSRDSLMKQRRRGSTTTSASSPKVKQSMLKNENKSGKRQHGATVSKEPKVHTIREIEDDDLNSGFGSYMRSGEGNYFEC